MDDTKKKRYEYKVTLGRTWNGQLIRKSFYSTKSKADAKRKGEKYRAQYELELLCGSDLERSRMLFKNFAVPCLEKYKKPYVKGNTYGGTYLHPVESRLVPYFGEATLQDILPIHVQDYVNKMAKKYKPETIKKDITVLSFIMQNAVDNGLCKINPVAKSVRLPKIERAEKTAYTQAQYDTVYEFAKKHPNGLAIMVLMETGISRSELLGLTWDDFDRENGVLHINQGLVSYKDVDEGWVTEADGLKNEYRHRSIPVVESELLKRLREKPKTITLTPNRYHPEITQQVETTFIFHSPEGKPYQPHNWNNRVFVPFMRELQKAHPEIPTLSAHELRHTRASLWIAGGMEPYMAARLLGHTDLKMLLKIYDHTNVETLRKALVEVRSDGEEEKRA